MRCPLCSDSSCYYCVSQPKIKYPVYSHHITIGRLKELLAKIPAEHNNRPVRLNIGDNFRDASIAIYHWSLV